MEGLAAENRARSHVTLLTTGLGQGQPVFPREYLANACGDCIRTNLHNAWPLRLRDSRGLMARGALERGRALAPIMAHRMAAQPGSRIGAYEILGLIGAGR